MCSSSPLGQGRSFECDIQIDRHRRSLAIPLPDTHIQRTESELELHENMAMAEYRDICMFNRLISGIRQRQELHYNFQSHVVDWNLCPDDSRESQLGRGGRGGGRRGRSLSCDGGSHGQSSYGQNHPAPPHRPPHIQDTEKSIENIISTRCNPIESAGETIATVTSYDTNEGNNNNGGGGGTFVGDSIHNNTNANNTNADDDWAIEGFEANYISSKQGVDQYLYNDIDHHVFHMDL